MLPAGAVKIIRRGTQWEAGLIITLSQIEFLGDFIQGVAFSPLEDAAVTSGEDYHKKETQ
jgi:hypothetical protein